jgi:hypothetical protein
MAGGGTSGYRPTAEYDPVAAQAEEDADDARIGGFKGAVIGAGKGLDDMFSAETVNAYNPDAKNFNLGGQEGFAAQRGSQLADHAGGLESQGLQVGYNQRAQGLQGLGGAQTAATRYNALGANTAASQGNLANQFAAQGQQGMALQQAQALGYGQQGTAGATAGLARAGTQQGQATNLQNQAYNLGNAFGDRSASALGRNDVGVANGYENALNRNLEAQGRAQQLQAAQALGYRANDNYGAQATQGFRNFAAQTGNGPSAAQAQMQQGADQSMASSLALARSGRGNNTQAVRGALFQNAATQQATNQQLGTLRAQEYDQAQNRQLGALNSESSALQGYRGQDLNALQGAAGVLGQARGQDQSQQQLGIGQGQYDANMALQNRQLNDATALGWAGQQQQAAQQQQQAWQAGQQLGNQSIAQGQGYNASMQGLGQQASQAGQQYDLGKGQLQNQAIGQGQNFQLGTGQLANQATAQGQNYNANMQGQANNYALGTQNVGLGYQGQASQNYGTQLAADMGFEQLRAQQYLAAQQSNQQADTQRDAATTGMLTSLMGGLMMSDEQSKKDIKPMDLGSAYAGLGFTLPEYHNLEVPKAPEEEKDSSGMSSGAMSMMSGMMSDEGSKKQISSLKGQLAQAYEALGGKPSHADFDDSYQGGNMPDTQYPSMPQNTRFQPRVDMRPAQGFAYDYKDPGAPGAAAGRHYGPMAQDLEKSPATASTVTTGPDGMKRVDPGRLTMLNTAALSDQQRDIQAIKQALASNNSASAWHPQGDVDVGALDEAYRRQAAGF